MLLHGAQVDGPHELALRSTTEIWFTLVSLSWFASPLTIAAHEWSSFLFYVRANVSYGPCTQCDRRLTSSLSDPSERVKRTPPSRVTIEMPWACPTEGKQRAATIQKGKKRTYTRAWTIFANGNKLVRHWTQYTEQIEEHTPFERMIECGCDGEQPMKQP